MHFVQNNGFAAGSTVEYCYIGKIPRLPGAERQGNNDVLYSVLCKLKLLPLVSFIQKTTGPRSPPPPPRALLRKR